MYELFKESFDEIFESIYEHNPDSIFVFTNDGKIKGVNPVVTKVFGYSPKELEGSHYQEFILHDNVEKADYYFRKGMRGESFGGKVNAAHRDGTILHLYVKGIPLTVKNEIVGIYCVARNLTESIKTKAALNEIEERFKAIFYSSADAIDLFDLNGNIVDVNPGFEQLYGWKREEVVGKPLQIVPPYQIEAANRLVERAKFGEIIRGAEVEGLRKDGTIITVHLTLFPVRDEKGEIVAVSGTARDITQQKQLAKSLEENEKQYRLLAKNSLDLIQLVNLDGIVTYASPSHQIILGFDPEEYIGKSVFYQPNREIDKAFQDKFLNMVRTHKSFTVEIVREHKQGYPVFIELVGTPVFDEDRNIEHWMMVGRNVTERIEYERHLEYLSSHDVLTGLPNRRLFNEKLEQAIIGAKRHHRKFAVLYMDIDHFKRINDTYGHDAGDQLLKQFSKRVRGELCESDILCRQGGDEFAVLLPEVREAEDALRVGEQILSSFQVPWQIAGGSFRTTSSIGIALYPKDGTTRANLMKHADIALYEAKENGRNRVNTYSCGWGNTPSRT